MNRGDSQDGMTEQQQHTPTGNAEGIGNGTSSGRKKSKSEEKGVRSFDMSKYRQRKVALLLQYNGVQYHGFASQAEGSSSEETIERHLFLALMKLRLIVDRRSCEYSRCGRTDKGR